MPVVLSIIRPQYAKLSVETLAKELREGFS